MTRNTVRTVTLPILVDADTSKETDGWGTWFPAQNRTKIVPVRVVQERDIKARLRSIFRPKDEELLLFVGSIELKQAHDAKDELALHRALEKVRPWIPSISGRLSFRSNGDKWKGTRWVYSSLISNVLQNARLIMWFPDNEERLLAPALHCPDWKTAAFVMTFLGRIRVCPKCSAIFIPSADNVDYCKPAHREAYRVARWRAQRKKK